MKNKLLIFLNRHFAGIICIFVLGFLWTSCGDSNPQKEGSELRKAEGSANYGGVFRYNEESYLRDFFPLNITEVVGNRAANNFYEGLVTMSQDSLKILPCLAENWSISEDGMEYTFRLRKGVKFHDDPCFPEGKGREMDANDVKFCFDLLCSQVQGNEGFWIFRDKVAGANEHFAASAGGNIVEGGVSGVEVIDLQTVKITLEKPFPDFIRLLVTPFTFIWPKESYTKYGAEGLRRHAVGTGPFLLTSILEGERIILRRNDAYWGKDEFGNQLPYLDAIRVSFMNEQKTALLEFTSENLDMLYRLPLEMADNVMMPDRKSLKPDFAKYQLQIKPILSFQYYGFQNKTAPFRNKKLREAFCYAIDRQKIVDFILKGLGTPAFHGIVPPAFGEISGYNTVKVKGFNFDPDKARKLLSEAGFPKGKGLGTITLQINSGGGRNGQIAEAIQKQLEETLNINVEILQLQFPQHLESVETGKANFWRYGWNADYTSPENYLRLFHGKNVPETLSEKSYLNVVRYQSAEYDRYFEEALQTTDPEMRNALYAKAEQKLIDDAGLLPLYFNVDVRLLQPNVRNFPQNAMEFRYFREVYFAEE